MSSAENSLAAIRSAIAAVSPASSTIQNNKYLTNPTSPLLDAYRPLLSKLLRRIVLPEVSPNSQSLLRFSRPLSGINNLSTITLFVNYLGILISGPSGCGKTSLALAIASAAGLNSSHSTRYQCMAVSCAELVQKVVGASEKMIADIFQAGNVLILFFFMLRAVEYSLLRCIARAVAPCFLLLDNIDVIFGSNNSNGSLRTTHQAIDRMLSALLVEIDGVTAKDNRAPVVVIATATHTACIDRYRSSLITIL